MASQQDEHLPSANPVINGDDTTSSIITPSSESTNPSNDDAAPPTPRLQRQQTDPNLRNCFICLQTSAETPDATWVNPCPCTLEAHEDCLLRWVSETEASSNRSKGLRCPACNARIKLIEPHDTFVRFRERMHRVYSRATPAVLLSLIATCGMAGSSWYGLMAASVFAGPDSAMRWLGLGRAIMERHWIRVPWWRWRTGWEVGFKFWLLHFIAPSLMLNKALPSLGSLFFVPASFLYGATLVARDEMPTWPPSPAWALTLMPYVSLTYSSVYYEFFGMFEKRLNRALRGRTQIAEEPPAAPQAQAGEPAERLADEEDEGIGPALFRLGNAVLNLFGGEDEVVLEAEVRLGVHEEEELAEQLQELEAEVRLGAHEEEELAEQLPELEEEVGPDDDIDDDVMELIHEAYALQADEDEHRAAQLQRAAEGDAAPAPIIRREREDDQPAAQEVPAAQDVPAQDQPVEENRPNTTLTDIVNGTVTALLFPALSFGVGEVLRLALPRAWVTRAVDNGIRRSPNGLLQERWGRSLVGGCLFVVMKDAVNLYTKYRRVEVRKHRHVKNVERRRGGQSTNAAS